MSTTTATTTTTVLVTGASGFIALHIVDALLKAGFKVIGTVRTQSQADKLAAQFKELYPEGDLAFEIVKDIARSDAFDEVLKKNNSITKVLHTASPFSFGLDKPLKEAYLEPAVEGTRNILFATKKFAPQVDRVVVTSSFVAIMDQNKFGDRSYIHTEESWNPIEWDDVKNEGLAYNASKKLAEAEVWRFIKDEKPNFTASTVNPPYVFGTQLFTDVLSNPRLNTSADIVRRLLATPLEKKDFITEPNGLEVDVRDVAFLHVKAIQDDNLAGKRLFPVGGAFTGQTLLNIIHKNFPELNGKVGTGDKDAAADEKFIYENVASYDTSVTLKLVGRDSWISLEETIVASIKQILDYEKAHATNA